MSAEQTQRRMGDTSTWRAGMPIRGVPYRRRQVAHRCHGHVVECPDAERDDIISLHATKAAGRLRGSCHGAMILKMHRVRADGQRAGPRPSYVAYD